MAAVDRGALGGLERPAGEDAHRHRHPRRACGRRADLLEALPGLLRHQADRRQLAHPALARPHRHGRVALGQLDRVVALLDAQLDVLRGHVLAQAREALAVAGAGDRWRHRHRVRSGPSRPRRPRRSVERPRPRPPAPERATAPGHAGHVAHGDHVRRQLVKRSTRARRRSASRAPAWSSSEVAGAKPPETTTRSHSNVRCTDAPSTPIGAEDGALHRLAALRLEDHVAGRAPRSRARRAAARRRSGVSRRSATATICDARVGERGRGVESAVRGRGDHGAGAQG